MVQLKRSGFTCRSLGKGQEACYWDPLAGLITPKVCPDCSGLLLATRRVTWAGPWQKRLLCARLVEVRESLTQIRRKQALQDSERKGTEQEANLRWALLPPFPGAVLGLLYVIIWVSPSQGRCSPALSAKLLVNG